VRVNGVSPVTGDYDAHHFLSTNSTI